MVQNCTIYNAKFKNFPGGFAPLGPPPGGFTPWTPDQGAAAPWTPNLLGGLRPPRPPRERLREVGRFAASFPRRSRSAPP